MMDHRYHPANTPASHASTQLDPTHTNPHRVASAQAPTLSSPHLDDVTFRHLGWQPDRLRVDRALHDCHGCSTRVERFRTCGSNAYVAIDEADPSHVAVIADYCGDRFCVPCKRAKGRQVGLNVMDHYKGRQLRFITLTLRNSDLPLTQCLDKLYQDFARLRRSKLWRNTVTGGIAFTEVKLGQRSGTWHPHLHVLVTGKFIHQKALSTVWHAITKTSFVVDVRFVKDRNKAVDYVTKYATKGYDTDILRTHDALCEAIRALHGRRLYIKFGDLIGVDLNAKPDKVAWRYVSTLQDLLTRARRRQQDAVDLLAALMKGHDECTADTPAEPPLWEIGPSP